MPEDFRVVKDDFRAPPQSDVTICKKTAEIALKTIQPIEIKEKIKFLRPLRLVRLFSRFRSSGSAVAVGRVRDRTTSSARTSPARAAAPPRPSVFLLSCLSVCLSACRPVRNAPLRPQPALPPVSPLRGRKSRRSPTLPTSRTTRPPREGRGTPSPTPGEAPGRGPRVPRRGSFGSFRRFSTRQGVRKVRRKE